MPLMKKGCQINVSGNNWFSDQNTCFSELKSFWATFLSLRSNLSVNILNLFSDIVVLLVFYWHVQFQTFMYPAKFFINLLQPPISSRLTMINNCRYVYFCLRKFYSSFNDVWQVIIWFDLGDLYSSWIFQECIDLAGNIFLFFCFVFAKFLKVNLTSDSKNYFILHLGSRQVFRFFAMTYYNEIQLRYLMFPCNQITALGYLKYIIMQQAQLLGKVRTWITWDQALFSSRFENNIPAGKAKRK